MSRTVANNKLNQSILLGINSLIWDLLFPSQILSFLFNHATKDCLIYNLNQGFSIGCQSKPISLTEFILVLFKWIFVTFMQAFLLFRGVSQLICSFLIWDFFFLSFIFWVFKYYISVRIGVCSMLLKLHMKVV